MALPNLSMSHSHFLPSSAGNLCLTWAMSKPILKGELRAAESAFANRSRLVLFLMIIDSRKRLFIASSIDLNISRISETSSPWSWFSLSSSPEIAMSSVAASSASSPAGLVRFSLAFEMIEIAEIIRAHHESKEGCNNTDHHPRNHSGHREAQRSEWKPSGHLVFGSQESF